MIEFKETDLIRQYVGSGAVDFFGRPGAGKDEQAKRLANAIDAVYISSGLIFRQDPTLSDEQRALMHAGGIVATSEYEQRVLPVFGKPEYEGEPFALSSVGRKRGEEDSTRLALRATGHPLRVAIHLAISEDDARARLSSSENRDQRGGRQDDSPEAVERRMTEFNNETIHVIKRLDDLGLIEEVDARMSKDDTELAVLNILAERARTRAY